MNLRMECVHMFVNYIIHDLIHFHLETKFMHSFIHSLMFVVNITVYQP